MIIATILASKAFPAFCAGLAMIVTVGPVLKLMHVVMNIDDHSLYAKRLHDEDQEGNFIVIPAMLSVFGMAWGLALSLVSFAYLFIEVAKA
ncbi:MAG: hypothetical protein EOP83_08080 [Verrucomicrobiaceae bacterium]|nr:MAG: hypothetical protein EOP83_08080 [Verrucomicrobiaceae bacterium]